MAETTKDNNNKSNGREGEQETRGSDDPNAGELTIDALLPKPNACYWSLIIVTFDDVYFPALSHPSHHHITTIITSNPTAFYHASSCIAHINVHLLIGWTNRHALP
jgi:hypothetical protein